MKRNYKYALAVLGMTTIIAANNARAYTDSYTVTMDFAQPFGISETTPMNMGTLLAGVIGTVDMEADGTQAVTGSQIVVDDTAKAPGVYAITQTGNSTAPVDITVDNPTANGGVTITKFDCKWGAANATGLTANACTVTAGTNPGASTNLTVGVTVSTDGTQADGSSATPGFDITVVYN